MDQYPATSVRLAKFLERFEGNIRGFMIDFAGTLSSLGDKLDVIQTEYDKNKQLRHDKIHLVLNGIYIGTVGNKNNGNDNPADTYQPYLWFDERGTKFGRGHIKNLTAFDKYVLRMQSTFQEDGIKPKKKKRKSVPLELVLKKNPFWANSINEYANAPIDD